MVRKIFLGFIAFENQKEHIGSCKMQERFWRSFKREKVEVSHDFNPDSYKVRKRITAGSNVAIVATFILKHNNMHSHGAVIFPLKSVRLSLNQSKD